MTGDGILIIVSMNVRSITTSYSSRTELTCVKLTQLHDALLVTRVSVTKLIDCRAAVRALLQGRAAIRELQFSSVQFS